MRGINISDQCFARMSHTRVKTTYNTEGAYGATDVHTLYCHHNHSCDYTTFYNENGDITPMQFQEWESDNDLWDAMKRLWVPFKDKWGEELKEDVKYYKEIGD